MNVNACDTDSCTKMVLDFQVFFETAAEHLKTCKRNTCKDAILKKYLVMIDEENNSVKLINSTNE